jgi:hypothetical protein
MAQFKASEDIIPKVIKIILTELGLDSKPILEDEDYYNIDKLLESYYNNESSEYYSEIHETYFDFDDFREDCYINLDKIKPNPNNKSNENENENDNNFKYYNNSNINNNNKTDYENINIGYVNTNYTFNNFDDVMEFYKKNVYNKLSEQTKRSILIPEEFLMNYDRINNEVKSIIYKISKIRGGKDDRFDIPGIMHDIILDLKMKHIPRCQLFKDRKKTKKGGKRIKKTRKHKNRKKCRTRYN